MSAIIKGGTSGVDVDSDSNKNLLVTEGLPAHPSAGGWYSVTGGTSAVVAASVSAGADLATMRFSAGSTRKCYIKELSCRIYVATVGTSALVAGALGWRRFTTATPSGGTARTPNEMYEALTTATDMTDCRDNNSALTVTSVVFGTTVCRMPVPLFISGGAMWTQWNELFDYPLVLGAGDGLSLQVIVATPATQTWQFTWCAKWYEA
jgi:hypothetical protein